MADPVQSSSQTAPLAEPTVVASASPTPQEPVAASAVPSVDASAPPAPAAPIPDAAPAADVAPAADAQLTLLQAFDKDAKAKDKPATEAKPAEPAKDAKVDPAKPADAKPVDAKDAKPAADAKPTDKPAEAAKPEDAKPVDAEATKPAEPAPLAPVEYKYELPKTLKMDDAMKGEVHTMLDEFRSDPGANVQKLIDFHAKTMEAYAAYLQKQMDQRQRDVFNETRKQWANDVKASDEIGGAGYQTSMGAIARMRDLVASDMMNPRAWDDGSPRASALDEFLTTTGAGDHPVFLTMLHRFAKFFDEASPPPPNPQPSPNNGARKPRGMKDLYADGPTKSS